MKALSRRDVGLFQSCWRTRACSKKVAESIARVNGQRPYLCENCGFYHLTSKPKKGAP